MNIVKLLCALFLILASLVSFTECGTRNVKTEPTLPKAEEPPVLQKLETITLPPETLKKYNLIAFQASEHELFKTISFPVRIDREENNITEITAGFAGKIDEVFADGISAPIQQGQPLFSITSPDVLKLQQNYINALRSAVEPGVEQSHALADAEAYRERLLELNFNPQDLMRLIETETPFSKFTFYSRVNGIVKTRRAAPGLAVQKDTVLFSISDVSDGIASGDIPNEDTDFIHIGMQGILKTEQFTDQSFQGQIFSIGEREDSKTKIYFIFRRLPQVPKFDKKGTITLTISLGSYISIPKQSVSIQNKQKIVYVPQPGGSFEPREIKTGLEGDNYVQVLSGLKEGDYVIANPEPLIK